MISKNVQLQIILKMICLAKNPFSVKFSYEKRNGPTQSCLCHCLTTSDLLFNKQTNSKFYPNISTILRLLFLMSVSAASVEISRSRLKDVKTKKRSVMSTYRLNLLMLFYVHCDLQLDVTIKLWTSMYQIILDDFSWLTHFCDVHTVMHFLFDNT